MTERRKEPYSKKIAAITPQLAKEWIDELNKLNYRDPRHGKVREYSALQKAGKWFPRHHDAIQFDWFGDLRNGQHRLLAIIDSGVTIEMYVERGLDPEAFNFSDKIAVRTLRDDLTAARFRRDVVAKAGPIARRMMAGLNSTYPEPDEVKEFALKYEDLIGVMQLQLKASKPYRSEIVAAYAKATFEWSDDVVLASAERYASRRFTGESSDPLSKLHDKVVSFRLHGGKSHELYSYAVSAVRADLEQRNLGNLQRTEQDFVGPWEQGHIPRERREAGRKAHAVMVDNVRSSSSRQERANEVLTKARNQGVKFLLDGNPIFARGVSGTTVRLVRELLPEIKMILAAEKGVVVS